MRQFLFMVLRKSVFYRRGHIAPFLLKQQLSSKPRWWEESSSMDDHAMSPMQFLSTHFKKYSLRNTKQFFSEISYLSNGSDIQYKNFKNFIISNHHKQDLGLMLRNFSCWKCLWCGWCDTETSGGQILE